MVDDIHYCRRGNENVLTFVFIDRGDFAIAPS